MAPVLALTGATAVFELAHVPPVVASVRVVVDPTQTAGIPEIGGALQDTPQVLNEIPSEALPFATTWRVYVPTGNAAGSINWTVSMALPVATAPTLFQ